MSLVTILRTKDAVQLFLGIGRAHLVLSMAILSTVGPSAALEDVPEGHWGSGCPAGSCGDS